MVELITKEIKTHKIGETLVHADCSAIGRAMSGPETKAEIK